MDILVSSNLERLLYMLSGDGVLVSGWMDQLRSGGSYDVGDLREKIAAEGFRGWFADGEQTARTIRSTWEEKRYLVDPHTAVGLFAAERYRSETGCDRPCVVLSTASPFKFAQAILGALGVSSPSGGFAALDALSALTGEKVPAPLAGLKDKPERFTGVVEPSEMAQSVERWLI